MLAARGLPDGPVVKQLLDWIAELEGRPRPDKKSANVSCQKAGRRVVLSGVSERVSRMFKITNVESLFLTFPTLEEAIGGLTRAGAA